MPDNASASVIPAQLSFLAIYNPRLGPTDETIQDQIVFYTSRSDRSPRRDSLHPEDGVKESNDSWNDKLRQIGLAQGIVGFARNFSEGKAVDYVETEKSQIILHELEQDWWILASVDLTRLPIDPATLSQRDASVTPSFTYSSREMCPPQLLIQQMRRAHSIFLLHNQFTLDALYDQVGRSTFCTLLENFWWRFAWSWEMLLSGNPIVDMYDGIKLSAGGELGIGVGEEEWGSGEREVLEDLVSRTDGLLDLIVSRFGEPCPSLEGSASRSKRGADSWGKNNDGKPWLGADISPKPSDGVIFSGVGALSRTSIVRVSQWMEWIYRCGLDAYAVSDYLACPRRRRNRKKHRDRLPVAKAASHKDGSTVYPLDDAALNRSFSPGIPRPLVLGTSDASQSLAGAGVKTNSITSSDSSSVRSDRGIDWMVPGTETFMKYLTLGYGSSWGPSPRTASPHPRVEALRREDESSTSNQHKRSPTDAEGAIKGDSADFEARDKVKNCGRFLIGFHDASSTSTLALSQVGDEVKNTATAELGHTIDQRTLHVQLTVPFEEAVPLDETPTGSVKLRTIVYVHQPFICTFLFDPSAPALSQPSFYHELRSQMSILHKSLCNSTSPATAAKRIAVSDSALEATSRFTSPSQEVYNLVYDSTNLTVRSSIPNIPDLGVSSEMETQDSAISQPWTRVESLNIHHRLLSTYTETRSRPLEVERTCKTSRGWWIVWMRMSDDFPSQPEQGRASVAGTSTSTLADTIGGGGGAGEGESSGGGAQQEAFLIRRSSDHIPSSGHVRSGSGSRFFRDLGGASSPGLQAARADTGPAKLVEGLGLDARRYIGNLLSLNK
ncbi:uncharacterized protein BP01DRAFT_415156 [Aspergillus saccharolyticus JOP 1030-1]|uniref:CCZ1/INTU/HSP4 first Longin domain-containing protein n=1 Tax=Aspergillus saccharolyticus JOP 1030-1 TaxID=1450539 RepID=A0A318ZNS7_9EURO|nr:hypothetical protein BP01DRAFT_415156 [Aspergillus saccharolyticus JOP 1030-1]PYH46103.1 hypothetical protein BP01DRAFT_415156 [Aspergillus saccharolyticus JOP 1030-1]